MGYHYSIEYKKGKENQGLSASSHKEDFRCQAIILPEADWWATLQQKVLSDAYYAQFMPCQNLSKIPTWNPR